MSNEEIMIPVSKRWQLCSRSIIGVGGGGGGGAKGHNKWGWVGMVERGIGREESIRFRASGITQVKC